MSGDSSQLPFDLDDLNAPVTAVLAENPTATGLLPEPFPESLAGPPRRPLSEVAVIAGGVFLALGLTSWLMITFVLVESPEAESRLVLPRNRMESMMTELPIGKVRHESMSQQAGQGPQSVFIVEIEASLIVQGTASELSVLESMLKSHHHRIEAAIDRTIRSATPEQLAEADAQVLRTRIRAQINKFYGKPVVKEVLFSHYRAFHTPIKK